LLGDVLVVRFGGGVLAIGSCSLEAHRIDSPDHVIIENKQGRQTAYSALYCRMCEEFDINRPVIGASWKLGTGLIRITFSHSSINQLEYT
jgi:hypothetical protein